MTETDHTLGMSTQHDFREKKWNREAALMQWLMFGQGARGGQDTYTGLYDSKEDALHAAQFEDDAAKAAVSQCRTARDPARAVHPEVCGSLG